MPRTARSIIPDCFYHVTQRGNYRQLVFEDDNDRIFYLTQINEKALKTGTLIYAFCLMSNHVHFIVKPKTENALARMFGQTHTIYAQYFNQKKLQTGHLWQARFYSCRITDSHLATAMRYVECNPERAGLVKVPWDYKWSSVRFHLGTPYQIIELADIGEYLDVKNWREFLLMKDDVAKVQSLQQATKRGKVFGIGDSH